MTEYGYYHDYTKTMWMKMFLASVDGHGGTSVGINFEQALEIIRKTDNITQGTPKIIYLVGWQYNGHDDRYPAFFEVNKALKRDCDKTAEDSLRWLIEAAKQYNTTVSLHINFSDAYENSPLFEDYKKAGALIRNENGEPIPIEHYNGLGCYKVSFKEEWESGLFKERIAKLMEIVPLAELGTVHVDNFQAYYNNAPFVDVAEQIEYRNKIIDYMHDLGVDITSEFTYREGEDGRASFNHDIIFKSVTKYPIGALGRIAAAWWHHCMTDEDIMNIPPEQYCGGLLHPHLARVFYGNMHGEDIWQHGIKDDIWVKQFIHEYATIQIPWQYLIRFRREKLELDNSFEDTRARVCHFSDGVISRAAYCSIERNGKVLKLENDLLLPLLHNPGCYLAYSEHGKRDMFYIPECSYNRAAIYLVTSEGNVFLNHENIENEKIFLDLKPGEAVIIKKAE